MTTITVSPSTHAKLVNDKTVELRSIEKVILNMYKQIEGIKPVEVPETVSVTPEQDTQIEVDPNDSVAIMDNHLAMMEREKEDNI